MAIAGKVLNVVVRVALYVATILTVLLPRVPDDRPDGIGETLILVAAMASIGLAVGSTVDWVRDTVRDIVATRRRKHDAGNEG